MAKALAFVQDNNIRSIEELEELTSATADDYAKIHSALKATEARLTKVNLMIKNTGQYLANKDVYHQYLNSKNKATFREAHRAEITLYEAARKYLQEESGGKKLPTIKQLKEEKNNLLALKNQQYDEYSTFKARHRQIRAVQHNIHTALGVNQRYENSKETEKKQEQSI